MNTSKFEIGNQVVRSKGDYVVGRIGSIVAIDYEKNRAQVEWDGESKTWVSFGSLELTSMPYEIVGGSYNPKTGKHVWPKYVRKASIVSTNY